MAIAFTGYTFVGNILGVKEAFKLGLCWCQAERVEENNREKVVEMMLVFCTTMVQFCKKKAMLI